ncbi:hypothetical protein JOM56_008522 [Amanita muscaria]
MEQHRHPSFYLVLFALVLPLWLITPLSWAFLSYAVLSGHVWLYDWPGRALVTATFLEALFSIYHYYLVVHISSLGPSGQCNLPEVQAAFKRLLKVELDGLSEECHDVLHPLNHESPMQLEWNDPRAKDFRNRLQTWFRKAAWSSIRLEGVKQWVFWSIYNSHMPPFNQLSPAQQAIIKESLEHIQMLTGCDIPEGLDPQNQPMRLTVDPVTIHWRPLFFYILVGMINRYCRWWFASRYNMKHDSRQGLEYLIRMPNNWDYTTGPRPVVFIHGLGLGFLQYSVFLSHLLNEISDRPVLVLLQPQISQDFFHPHYLKPLNRQQTVEKLRRVLTELGWVDQESVMMSDRDTEGKTNTPLSSPFKASGITVLSHSNGSYSHAWLLKDCPEIVARSCFVDPVTFCSWEGDVCYNFVYRRPSTGLQLLMYYFVATELGVANLLRRHFDWVSNSLWCEEIPNVRDPTKTLVVLGGKDDIVSSERVTRYLLSHGVKKGIRYNSNGQHGQSLVSGDPGLDEILMWLKDE